MKKIFISLMLLLGISSFAQEAGKAGELLKNEASTTEMRSPDHSRIQNNIPDRNAFDPRNKIKNPSYQWNRNYGYAEVFLRIPEQGFFMVEVGDQMIANGSGKYRFFDLQSGRMPVSIYANGFLIYRTTLMLRNNSRVVLDFFTNEGLYLLDSYPVQGQYGFNDWNDVWNNPYGNQSGNWNNPGNVMDNNTFQQFFDMLKRKESFDDGKIKFINQQMRTSMFTAAQIRDLVKSMSFDKNKLALAKSMYGNCVDKNKYFVVTDAFDFENSRRELMDYISKL
ncbi:hypothetical protein C1637_15720 [Chryseobacterium lactis]|uniref:DUF4476 domain-containing protein n=1 Tax=Chryseobacterium lactis TaxID=1241981 RepID=A0A3G6RKB7_CHRLC|nr:DUF4476 domain-containing protein [Chryseobacterium lactis]AZA83947.1 DUF4476 domain-containing protein [Chryseobacterium lactis]AZB04333.1 DUF4476 domain-containing protein [Chryseobacterium lactis]PNW12504.1 hypothetical protein C1637_15720 [Chryseobacterium lactis]